ncbi:hypothetical protein [Streptosporangium canum]|uniref:hypothetical protein n=1 Tax=Streptosporangium canum TaxID=324952 RepID=UPI0034261A4E
MFTSTYFGGGNAYELGSQAKLLATGLGDEWHTNPRWRGKSTPASRAILRPPPRHPALCANDTGECGIARLPAHHVDNTRPVRASRMEMKIMSVRKTLIGTSVAAVLGAAAVLSATTASASGQAAETPATVCGPGYKVERQASFTGGVAYLLYNAGKQNACAVTFKTKDVGTRTLVWSAVDVKGAGVVKNEEITPLHTVPVYHAAPAGSWVKFSGGTKTADSGGGYEPIR